MHPASRDNDVSMAKILSGCREAQSYAKPRVDNSKYERGVKCEQKLAALMNIAIDTPSCVLLRSELETLDDLVYQLKYLCMEPMLKMIEDIESNVNKYLNTLPLGLAVAVVDQNPATIEQPEIWKEEDILKKEYYRKKSDDPSYDPFRDDFYEDDFSEEAASTQASEDPDSYADDKSANYSADASLDRQFDVILEEPEESSEQNSEEESEQKSPVKHINIPTAIQSSQATINNLLEALDGSGDTLDLIQAALEMKLHDSKMELSFDSELDAANAELELNSLDGSLDGSADIDTEVDTDDDSIKLRDSNSVHSDDFGGSKARERQNALSTAQEEKCFDRLRHLFDVRKKVEKRMKRIDPSERLKNIQIVTHSGGIQEEDGSYKTMYQQQNKHGKIARNLGEVYDGATQCKSCFLGLVYSICDKVKGLDHFDAVLAELKPHDRASEKAKSDYSHRLPGPSETWLYDVLRATITCNTVKQVETINKFLSKKAHIVQAKNRFAAPAYNGYRDLLYHVRVKYEFEKDVYFIAEIQVQHKEVASLQNLFGLKAHMLYFRSSFSGPERSVEETLKDLKILDKPGLIDEKLMRSLLKSEKQDQLAIIAELLHDKMACYGRALELYKRILVLQKSTLGENHAKTAATYQSIGLVQSKAGDFDSALLNLKKTLEIQEAIFGTKHPEVATTLSHLGHIILLKGDGDGKAIGKEDGALQQHRHSLAIREKTHGSNHVDVAASYQNIGLSLGQLGDFDGALAAYRKALKILQSALNGDHPDVAATHSMIGTILCCQGDFDQAMKEYEQALKIRVDALGKNHPTTADSHTEIGNMLCEKGDYEKSLSRHREALRIRGAVLGKDHPDCAVSLSNCGYVLNQMKDYEAALREHRKALSIRDAILGKRHPDSLASRRSIKFSMNREPEV
jgi:tetratricopeptide (TPR) repeat protein